jgi:hypothetical protein
MDKLSHVPKKAPLKISQSSDVFLKAMHASGYSNQTFCAASKIKKVTLTSWSRVDRKVPGYAFTALWLLQQTLLEDKKNHEPLLYVVRNRHISKKILSTKKVESLLTYFVKSTTVEATAKSLDIHPITASLFYQAFRERLNTFLPSADIEEGDMLSRMPVKNNSFTIVRKRNGTFSISILNEVIDKELKDQSNEMLDFFDYMMDEVLEYSHFCSDGFFARAKEKTVRFNLLKEDIYTLLLESIKEEPLVLQWQ